MCVVFIVLQNTPTETKGLSLSDFLCRMASKLATVDELSDAEPAKHPKPRPKRRSLNVHNLGRKRAFHVRDPASNDRRKHLANLIRGRCGCSAGCFSSFREQQVEEWMKLRKTLAHMKKLEKDQYARAS